MIPNRAQTFTHSQSQVKESMGEIFLLSSASIIVIHPRILLTDPVYICMPSHHYLLSSSNPILRVVKAAESQSSTLNLKQSLSSLLA